MVDLRRLTAAVLLILVVTFMATTLSGDDPFDYFLSSPFRLVLFGIVPLSLVFAYAATAEHARGQDRLRTGLVWALILVCTVPLFVLQIAARRGNGPATHIHDGAVQTEEASRFFRQGVNPYSADFRSTAFGAFIDEFSGGTRPNPAWTHYVYLPATFLIVVPFQAATEANFGWFDIRLVSLAGWLLLIGLLTWRLSPPWRDLALILVAFNPFVPNFLFNGVNDFMLLLFLVGATFLLERSRLTLAGLVFALALASKQSAWIVLPFFLVAILRQQRSERWMTALKPLWPGAALLLVLVGPFAVWSFPDFVNDVWSYANGSAAFSYPASGLGLGQWLVTFGVLNSPFDPFPFWIPMLVVGLPVLGWALRRQWRTSSSGALLWYSAWGLLAVWSAARYFNDTHLGFLMLLFTIGAFFLQRDEGRPTNRPAHESF